jgi:hypothetical protein
MGLLSLREDCHIPPITLQHPLPLAFLKGNKTNQGYALVYGALYTVLPSEREEERNKSLISSSKIFKALSLC